MIQKLTKMVMVLMVPASQLLAQTSSVTAIQLTDLSAFKNPGKNWSLAGRVQGSFDKVNGIKTTKGTGILVNIPGKDDHQDLFTNMQHSDLDLSLEFMVPKGSNSGIYLQGRYEIQILDSWGKKVMTDSDLGAVYQRWDETRPAGQFGYEGVAPRQNVSRAPGLWQTMRIQFIAPRFDASGKKTANARIVKIVVNDVAVIENVELQGVTRGSAFAQEAATGPLRIQGDHGAIAIRNIRYSPVVEAKAYEFDREKTLYEIISQADHQYLVNVQDKPVVFRSFVDIAPKKRLSHAAHVGYPGHISYGYDLASGALFRIWKGGFLDATTMWYFRGDGNSIPTGSIVPLSAAPQLAFLQNETAAWPDTLAEGEYTGKGYVLDKQRYPTFKYIYHNINIEDRIMPAEDDKVLVRRITATGAVPANLYTRIAVAKEITDMGEGMYAIDGYSYYIRMDKDAKPMLRDAAGGRELLLPLDGKETAAQYTLIW